MTTEIDQSLGAQFRKELSIVYHDTDLVARYRLFLAPYNNSKVAMSDEESTTHPLYLPKYCVIPLEVRDDPNLSDSCKIYLGELEVLSNRYGYIWCSDKDLAQMKGVSLRTIERRHRELENAGYIYRQTTKKHYKVNDPESGKEKLRVRTERRMFVGKSVVQKIRKSSKLKKVSDPPYMAARCDPPNVAGSLENRTFKIEKDNVDNVTMSSLAEVLEEWQRTGDPIQEQQDHEELQKLLGHQKEDTGKEDTETLASFEERGDFVKSLDDEQRKLHDELIAYEPLEGPTLESSAVCAWFKANKWTVAQIREAFEEYVQATRDMATTGTQIKNMGGWMVSMIRKYSLATPEDRKKNRIMAQQVKKQYPWVEVTKRYVKVHRGNVKHEVEINQPHERCREQLRKYVMLAVEYSSLATQEGT